MPAGLKPWPNSTPNSSQFEPSYNIETCIGGWPNDTVKSSQLASEPFSCLNTTAWSRGDDEAIWRELAWGGQTVERLARVGRKCELDQIQANSIQLEPSGWPNDTQLHPTSCELGPSWLELGGTCGQGLIAVSCPEEIGTVLPAPGRKTLVGPCRAPCRLRPRFLHQNWGTTTWTVCLLVFRASTSHLRRQVRYPPVVFGDGLESTDTVVLPGTVPRSVFRRSLYKCTWDMAVSWTLLLSQGPRRENPLPPTFGHTFDVISNVPIPENVLKNVTFSTFLMHFQSLGTPG